MRIRFSSLLSSTIKLNLILIHQSNSQSTTTQTIKSPSISNLKLTDSTQLWFHLPAPPTPTLTFITLNLCSSGSGLGSGSVDYQYNQILIVSNSSDNQTPSPSNLPSKSHRFILSSLSASGATSDLRAGFANVTLLNSVGLWINLQAPRPLSSSSTSSNNNNNNNNHTWNFQLGVSTGNPLHSINRFPAFKLEDTDRTSALLTASDSSLFLPITTKAPLSLREFVPVILATPTNLEFGLSASLCYLQTLVSTVPPQPLSSISPSLTSRTTGIGLFSSQDTGNPDDHDYRISPEAAGLRTQYLINNLQPATNYTAWLFQPTGSVDNVQIGTLWPYINFRTKATQNCRLVHDLGFCPSVAYSVPSPASASTSQLISFYNQTISGNLTNFRTVLSTYPCNNDTSGRYSFVSGCEDCFRAYNDWLCSVSMPRCTDPDPSRASLPLIPSATNLDSSQQQMVLTRMEANGSRTASLTDPTVYPYGEILPCETTCTLVAATCPPLIGWTCPLRTITLEASYRSLRHLNSLQVLGGQHTQGGAGGLRAIDRFGNVFCNSLDSDIIYSRLGAAPRAVHPPLRTVSLALILALLLGSLL